MTGGQANPSVSTPLKDSRVLDTTTGVWVDGPTMTAGTTSDDLYNDTGKTRHGMVEVNNRLYILGGYGSDGTRIPVLNLATMTYNRPVHAAAPGIGADPHLIVAGGKIYGFSYHTNFGAKVYSMTPNTNLATASETWVQLSHQLPVPVTFKQAVAAAVNGKLYVIYQNNGVYALTP